jgi:hypothetical protein
MTPTIRLSAPAFKAAVRFHVRKWLPIRRVVAYKVASSFQRIKREYRDIESRTSL